jgi:hypothetical protein
MLANQIARMSECLTNALQSGISDLSSCTASIPTSSPIPLEIATSDEQEVIDTALRGTSGAQSLTALKAISAALTTARGDINELLLRFQKALFNFSQHFDVI